MKPACISILAIVFLVCAGCSTMPQPETEPDDGFTMLFNGKDFTGWDLKIRSGDEAAAQQVFSVNDQGWVHVYAAPFEDGHELNTGKNDTHGLFFTDKTYSRFIFRFEYKWGEKRLNNFDAYQYDAGMYYHVYDDKIWPGGIEYQVRYNHVTGNNHTGDFWAAGKCRFTWTAGGDDGQFLLPNDGGVPQPIKRGEHRAKADASFHALDGEWNLCEVIVMGDQYAIHKLNGEIVNMGTGLNVAEGKIGLQAETAEIFYRNIEIKEFDAMVPMEQFLK